MATCSARLVHIIAESYAGKGKSIPLQPVLLYWSTSLQRVMLAKERGLHSNLFTLLLIAMLSKVRGVHGNMFF